MPDATNIESARASPPAADGLSAFFALADVWKLTTDQQITLLGSPGRSTYFKWKKDGGVLSPDTAERISHLVSIYKALQVLFPQADRADAWIERPHRFFGVRPALEVMLGGGLEGIILVRDYLDAQRGG